MSTIWNEYRSERYDGVLVHKTIAWHDGASYEQTTWLSASPHAWRRFDFETIARECLRKRMQNILAEISGEGLGC